MKRLVVYHVITVIFLLLMFSLGFCFLFPICLRTKQVCIEFGYSCAYYVQELFECGWGIKVLVNQNNFIKGFSMTFLPETPELFFHQIGIMFLQMFSKDFAIKFLNDTVNFLDTFTRIFLILIPLLLMLILLINLYFNNQKASVGKINKSVILLDRINDKWLIIKANVLDYLNFFKSKKYYVWISIIGFLYFTNIINIIIAFLSFYLYLCTSLDFISVVIQVIRLIVDLSFMFKKWLIPAWLLLIIFIIHKVNTNRAENHLAKLFSRNKLFVDNLGISTFITGVMAKGKTTLMTDFVLTQEVLFKDVSYEMLIDFSLKFPSIDFRLYEKILDKAIADHKIFNLSSARKWARDNILEHDEVYFNGITEISLTEVLFNYACLYWLYTCSTSYIYSNYAVRSSLLVYSNEHLMEWANDLLSPSSFTYDYSLFSHIIDFNNFRSLRLVDNRLEWANSEDVGVYGIDEIGKERLNALEMEDVKKSASTVNQKNDGFNSTIKMARHKSTINHYPFFKLFMAEQRDQSVNADLRELNDCIIEIQRDSETKVIFPNWWFIDWVLSGLINTLMIFYKKYRHSHDEISLFYQLLKDNLSWLVRLRERFINKYSVKTLKLNLLDGSGMVIGNTKYYLIYRKIYANRFSTDAFSDYFERETSKSSYGLDDVITYGNEKATLDELSLQNSFFIDGLLKKKEKETNPSKQSSSKGSSKYRWIEKK